MASEETHLPKGWAAAPLRQVIQPRNDKVKPSDHPEARFIGMDHVESHSTKILGFLPAMALKSSAASFRAGDVLYGRLRPYLNKVAQPNFNGLASAEFIVFPNTPLISSNFLKHRLNAADFVSFASHLNEGDRPRVSFDQISEFAILIPPPSEQCRIVAKIEELFSELDKGVESLKTARAKLNVYRQAVLKHAFEGKLTAQWREKNKDKLGTAQELLARIKKDRELHYQAEIQEWKLLDKKQQDTQEYDYKPDKPRRLSNLVTITANTNEVVPTSWLSLKLYGVCDIVDGDRGPNYPKKDEYLTDGFCLFLNAKNVTANGFVFDKCQFITKEKHRSLRKGSVEIGDIIFTSRGTIGNVALHSSGLNFRAIRINSGMFILRNYFPIMIGNYFALLLMSPIITKQIKRLNSGTAQPQLPIRDFKQFVIPVPPIPEQEVIVRIIEAKVSRIETIAGYLARQLSLAHALRQSILKKAFAGQLVPQDPNDEPASVLLNRIRAEREKAGKHNHSGKPKKRKTAA